MLLDNYDSYTYYLVDYLHQLKAEIKIFQNDEPFEKRTEHSYKGIILSTGPEKPDTSGRLYRIIAYYQNLLPIPGICLVIWLLVYSLVQNL